jgi:hypothetical protein
MKIAKSFPLMQQLTLYNRIAQKNKFDEQSKDDNRHRSIIEYPYLTYLDLADAHDDYVEQFLLDIKTSFRIMLQVEVAYESVQRVTHNFTRAATRINCKKFIYFSAPSPIARQQKHKDYFPDTLIRSYK